MPNIIEIRPQDIANQKMENNVEQWTQAMLNADCFVESPRTTRIQPFEILSEMKQNLKEAKTLSDQFPKHLTKDIYRLPPTIGIWLLIGSVALALTLYFDSCMIAYAWSPLVFGFIAIVGLIAMKKNDNKRQQQKREAEYRLNKHFLDLEKCIAKLMKLNWFCNIDGIAAYSFPMRKQHETTHANAVKQGDEDAASTVRATLNQIDHLILEWKQTQPKGFYLIESLDDFSFIEKKSK